MLNGKRGIRSRARVAQPVAFLEVEGTLSAGRASNHECLLAVGKWAASSPGALPPCSPLQGAHPVPGLGDCVLSFSGRCVSGSERWTQVPEASGLAPEPTLSATNASKAARAGAARLTWPLSSAASSTRLVPEPHEAGSPRAAPGLPGLTTPPGAAHSQC